MKVEELKTLKAGDRVRIVSERGEGHWNNEGKMDKWLGKIMTVDCFVGEDLKMVEDKAENFGCGWYWEAPMIAEKINPCTKEIHITVDGNKTIAVLKENGKVINRAETKCAPEDKFEFETGAKLALSRLFKEVKEIKRKAKVGEYIKIVNAEITFGDYGNGDIFKVKKIFFNNVEVEEYKAFAVTVINDREYVVLENYKPVEKKEKKDEFKPHLTCGKTHYGVIGESTNYKDIVGRPLFIGDTVEHYSSDNCFYGETSIVKKDDKAFVMGISSSCNDKTGGINDGWKIIKKRSFEEIKDGEKTYLGVEYIKTEKGR